MDTILQDMSLLAPVIAAIDANFAEEMAAFGRYLPGAELHEDPEVEWFITGLPSSLFNGVLLTNIHSDDIDAKIEEIQGHYKARRVPMSWGVGQSTRPANLGTYLEAHGFTYVDSQDGMAADLRALNEDIVTPYGLRIDVVRDQEMLKLYMQVSRRGFESLEDDVQIYYDTYTNIGFGKELKWQHFIGWLDDEPVAVSSLLLHAGVAGVYGVATIPEARRQGVGAAMTLAALREARGRGYNVGVLSPSEMGLGMYRQLGFREYCTVQIYTYQHG